MTSPSGRATWLVFLALGLMWGSSYLWIKIGVETLPPLTLVTGRLLFGTLVLVVIAALTRQALPRDPRTYGHLAVLAVISTSLPFWMITTGEQTIDSALAAILNATVPLFVAVIAPFILRDERLGVSGAAGLAIGFAGVVVLFGPDLVNLDDGDFSGELLLVGSSVSYACGGVYARRTMRGTPPIASALIQVGFALLIVGTAALVVEQPIGRITPAPEALIAVAWLGVFGSGLAYLAWFILITRWSATRASLVAYLLPVIGIVLGTLRGEAVTAPRIAGTALIIAGVALVNSREAGLAFLRRLGGRQRPLEAPATQETP